MTAQVILAVDQGSTSTRAVAFDLDLRTVASSSRQLTTRHPQPGWVEQDPDEILRSVVDTVAEVLGSVPDREVVAVGIDNQGETVVAWDAETGMALAPAISWQCNRSQPIVDRLLAAGHGQEVRERTGLPLDPYFSAGKMTWLLENVDGVRSARRRGTLRLGTVDAWLTWHLVGEALTDPSTASRTQLLDIDALSWSARLAELFDVPLEALPRIVDTAGHAATLHHPEWAVELPLAALACDQQAALAGHGAFAPGAMKATYGTGVFVLTTSGDRRPSGDARLLTTIAWRLPGRAPTYALDGGVYSAGTLLDWLVRLGVLDSAASSDRLARTASDAGRVRILPALGGLGAPWWRPEARAVMSNLRSGTTAADVARAALDGIAQRTADVVEAMLEAGVAATALRVDGGLAANAYLVERQADLIGIPVEVASIAESTALGVAGLAGIGAGCIAPETIAAANPPARRIEPRTGHRERERERAAWKQFVEWAAQPIGPS